MNNIDRLRVLRGRIVVQQLQNEYAAAMEQRRLDRNYQILLAYIAQINPKAKKRKKGKTKKVWRGWLIEMSRRYAFDSPEAKRAEIERQEAQKLYEVAGRKI